MNDNYQAVFDAVRSRIGNVDIGAAVESAMRDANIGHHAMMACENVRAAADQASAPHVLMRPKISIDGNAWCALYGDNLMEGVAGFGDSPAAAMAEFDRQWTATLAGSKP